MSSDIRAMAELVEAPFDEARTQAVLEAFPGFQTLPVEFRTTTKPVGSRDVSFRFVDFATGDDPYARAREAGLLPEGPHPVLDLVPELGARFPWMGYGVDGGASHGLEKIWPFLAKAYPLGEAVDMASTPSAIAGAVPLLQDHRIEHFSIVAADYRNRTMNLYCPLSNPEFYTPQRLSQLVTDAGFEAPTGPRLAMLERAAFVNLTFSWDHDAMLRMCVYLPVPDRALLPPDEDPLLATLAGGAPFLTERSGFILGPTWGKDTAYLKVENDYTGTVMGVFGAAMFVERVDAADEGRRVEREASAGRSAPGAGGFEPGTGVFTAEPGEATAVPKAMGAVSLDAGLREELGRDFGHLRQSTPCGVLRPESAEEVQAAVRFANEHDLPLAAAGRRHACLGQAQVDGGLAIDMRTLLGVEPREDGTVRAEAGATFREVCARLLPDRVPAVLPDYLDISIGGVLSVGGIGGRSFADGLVVDTVSELEVVTGVGERVVCSPTEHADLFHAVLGGLGQFGIITAATLRTVPAPELMHVRRAWFDALPDFLRAQRRAAQEGLFDFLEGQVCHVNGAWRFVLEAGSASADGLDETVASLGPTSVDAMAVPFPALLMRVGMFEQNWRASGSWKGAHPWLDLFVPDDAVEAYLQETLAELSEDDLGEGVFLVFPFVRPEGAKNLALSPDAPMNWLVDILRFDGRQPMGASHLRQNRVLFDRAVAMGGLRYPIAAVELGPEDHRHHYGARWDEVCALKERFDPRGILTPGQRVFG